MRVTIAIDDDILVELKRETEKAKDKSFKNVVNETLLLGLRARTRLAKSKPFRVRSRNLGVYPDVNYDKISELLEIIEESEREGSTA